MDKYIVAVPKWIDTETKVVKTQGAIVDGKNYSDERLEALTTGNNEPKKVILVKIPEPEELDEEDESIELDQEDDQDSNEEVADDQETDDQELDEELDEEDDVEYPYHKGGGYWLLSNGETVKGKEEAQEAQSELDGE